MKCSSTRDSSASSRSSAISATTPATMALAIRNHSSRLQLRGQSWMPSRRGVWGTCSSRLVMATKGAVDDRWWRELECSWLGWG